MELLGRSILGPDHAAKIDTRNTATFTAVDPATGKGFAPVFYSASEQDVQEAVQLADEAFAIYGKLSGSEKGVFLRNIAVGLEGIANQLVARAHLETGLPKQRLQGETARTVNQLRLFAQVVEEGSWPMARIDTADTTRAPLPKPDIRSMLLPLGPVVVFGASNFPLAFSVAGGDTASALAAGNPVIVKAHPAHPGTSELVGRVIQQSVRDCGLPAGVFALLFDAGIQVGTALVQHPLIKAVAFTGSLGGGKALMQLAAARPEPIPCFAEMSSTNPFFVLPEALHTRGLQIATGLYQSFTLGSGQFCTKPGLVFLPEGEDGDAFTKALTKRVTEAPGYLMLTENIRSHYRAEGIERRKHGTAHLLAESAPVDASGAFQVPSMLFQIKGSDLLKDRSIMKEVFGPTTLLVRYPDLKKLMELTEALEGQLTATVHATEREISGYADLLGVLERKAGRVIFNGYPTGVEVCHAMVHGGPYPATSDSRMTSVGSQAIYRFARPVCYQDCPQAALPDELKDENPLQIWRMVNGQATREAILPQAG